jgi:hypothetical protein
MSTYDKVETIEYSPTMMLTIHFVDDRGSDGITTGLPALLWTEEQLANVSPDTLLTSITIRMANIGTNKEITVSND